MGVVAWAPYFRIVETLDKAVNELFDADPQIQAVGIARHENAFGFKAIKNSAKMVPASAAAGARKKAPKAIKKVPVTIETVANEIEAHVSVSHPQAASFVAERGLIRPLVCGLQIQNVDDDNRQRKAGELQEGFIIIGTLGCFVALSDGSIAALSNNHVLAGENRGLKGKDRILQPGNLTFAAGQHVATLTDFIALNPSPNNARPAKGNVVFNAVDAAVAKLEKGVAFAKLTCRPANSRPHMRSVIRWLGTRCSRSGGLPDSQMARSLQSVPWLGRFSTLRGTAGSTSNLKLSETTAQCSQITATRDRQL